MVSVSVCWWVWWRDGWWGQFEGNPPNELTVHTSNTWSVKPPTTVILLKKKTTLPLVNVKILSPAAFQSKVCGSAGEMAAGTDHVQDVGSVPQQQGDNQSPENESSESRSFQKMSEPPFACLECSACKHSDAGNTHPYLTGEGKGLLNGNSVTSATQDSPLRVIKLRSLSFDLSPIFVKYLQSTTKPNSQQMSVYTTLWTRPLLLTRG